MNIEDVTPAQAEAITSDHPNLLVIAGPGSGKTATTVARIQRLIQSGVDPSKIVALTFTNAAAREMEKRLIGHKAIGVHGEGTSIEFLHLGYIGTLHGFALRMLKQYGAAYGYGDRMSIIGPESARDLLASKAAQLGCKVKLADLEKLKAQGRPPRSSRLDVPQTVIASYYSTLKESGIVDFDMLLTEFLALIEPNGMPPLVDEFDYLFVDEVQDSADIDWQIYRTLPIPNKFMVGDPDQGIYSFRGGDILGMLQYAEFPWVSVIKLEQNFRSHTEICFVAQNLIEHNTSRIAKQTISAKGVGGLIGLPPPAANQGDEIAQIEKSITDRLIETDPLMRGDEMEEIAILCRTNALAFDIQKELTAAGLPVVQREKSDLPKDWPLARALIELTANPENDTMAYFYLIALHKSLGATDAQSRKTADRDRQQAAAAGQSINQYKLHIAAFRTATDAVAVTYAESISQESRMLLAEIARELDANATPTDLALALSNRHADVKEEAGTDGIHVLTIHAAKGREFDAVYLAGFDDEIIPGNNPTAAEVEEERRLAYVAITRARRFLMITSAKQRLTKWGAIASHQPSRFIKEITG